MRERLNSDPKLQIGLGAVLLLVVAFFILGKGGGEETPAEEPVAAVSEAGTTEALAGEVAGATGTEVSPTNLTASIAPPALPRSVVRAYDSGKTVVLLVVRPKGIDDPLVASATRGVAGNHDVHLGIVPVSKVANYGAITFGLDVQRVPALIVMRPKALSKGQPEASVLYGYQTPESVQQAVRDVSYHGPEGTYHPH
jgi:hypothetical protein